MKIGFIITSGVGIILLLTTTFAGIELPVYPSVSQDLTGQVIDDSFSFSEPEFIAEDNYVRVTNEQSSAQTNLEGYPELPYKTIVYTFPIGTMIKDIVAYPSEVSIQSIERKIIPAAKPMTLAMENVQQERSESSIYNDNTLYPPAWIDNTISVGLYKGQHSVILSLQIYPIRYAPLDNQLYVISSIDIEINYDVNYQPLISNDAYDLVIIAPSDFASSLQPLVDHKESHGLATKLVTLDEIYSGTYFSTQGRDDAEFIKYFIRDTVEQWGAQYVLLVGGRHGGITEEKWWCPVRYSYLNDNSDEDHFLSDLYFSDIYKYDNGTPVFDNWDSNDNGVYGEWSFSRKDVIDMYPDVYIGRLACRNSFEVDIMVEKIITYETTAYNSDWATKFVGVAGDTYPDSGDLSIYEGERATEAAFNLLDGYEASFIWTSTGTLADADDIIDAINSGCGFLHFSGHGNPMSWANHPPEDGDTWIGIDETQFIKLKNEGMYPVCIVGGCHNSQFNISLLNLLDIKNLQTIYYKSLWGPESWGWWLTRKIDGGTIATIANSGYGYGEPGAECLEKRGRYMELQFFKCYSEGVDMLGATHAQSLAYYLDKFPPLSNQIDSKIVEQWVLLGDPSLKIGGYPS